ncbi:hypothetical protein MNBD_GAMMA09-2545 [hydrothermal vent metagenome]|uniref:PepSY domain-containing protein n=1 Tax=hydrothermal vent metagenome TaxID=652676 RepID=A0A3B0YMZ9_9ZZZZ
MKLRSLTHTALLLSIVLIGLSQSTLADDDYIEARRLQDSGEILPLQTLLEKIKPAFTGKVLEIELEKEKGQIVYEVEILGKDGIVREIYINARTGEILSIKEDD